MTNNTFEKFLILMGQSERVLVDFRSLSLSRTENDEQDKANGRCCLQASSMNR
ncbi:hypothetical protein DAPPUDRAFT_252572 [Daphnia pulex]|uniref:Uncharacterized protein n=1 Tax=Daphnia pulex TaxID=6669 RepID=E9H307_DAPPU|nr:hypothetical protein DAPPUDRAFT_252572 [Daphnia pulex]|eukprot:EFX73877.1 hypothetical protein DAPPUDRAFT_252572 [Daphnia pulex]